jgi:hypothetical protein
VAATKLTTSKSSASRILPSAAPFCKPHAGNKPAHPEQKAGFLPPVANTSKVKLCKQYFLVYRRLRRRKQK